MNADRSFFFAVKPGSEPVQLQRLSAHERLPWVAQGYGCFEFRVSGRCIEHWKRDDLWMGAYPTDIDAFAEFILPESIEAAEDAVDEFIADLLNAEFAAAADAHLSALFVAR